MRASEPDGVTGNFKATQIAVTNISRGVWHRLDIVAKFYDGDGNDTFEFSLDGVPVVNPLTSPATTWGTFEGWRNGNGFPYALTNRLFWRSGAPPTSYGGASDTGALGFYFDQVSYSVVQQSAPGVLLASYATSFEALNLCDDFNACTLDTCSPTLGCQHTPITCNDGNVCTVDTCDPAIGCVYTPGNAGTVCRATAGDCDVAETCTGASAICPPDGYKPTSFVCRASAGDCDLPDYCPGNAASCTADAKSTAVCRPVAGVCDVAESCNGVNDDCPADGFKTAAVVCRPAAGPCDVTDYCPGSGAACTTDAKSTAVCRAAAGVCDVAESCSGTSDLCPPDAFKPGTDVCRASGGVCDVTEYCAGGGSAALIYDAIPSPLPPNLPSLGYEATSTTEFGDAINLGGTERFVTDVTVTMSAWALHSAYPGLGTADGWTHPITLNIYGVDHSSPPIPGLGTPLKSVTQTFLIPWRPEADPTCPGGTAWRSPSDNQCYNGLAFDITFSVNYDATGNNDLIFGIVYNTADYGPVPIHAPGPYNSLNVALHSAGTDPAISPGSDIEPAALFWNTSHVPFYTNPACLGGTFCRDTAWAPYSPAIRIRAVSAYPVDCPVDGKSTAECRPSAGVCDVAESCNGTDNDCPVDGYKPTSFVCRVSVGDCDLPDNCPGNAASLHCRCQEHGGLPCSCGRLRCWGVVRRRQQRLPGRWFQDNGGRLPAGGRPVRRHRFLSGHWSALCRRRQEHGGVPRGGGCM